MTEDDPRIIEGKRLILEAIKERQRGITGIRPANSNSKQSYEEVLQQFAKCRGSKLYYPYVGSGIGNGPLVELLDGSVKYDCINGIGVHILGHSHPLLIEAALDAAMSNTIMQGNLQQNKDSLELIQLLTRLSGKDHCFLTTSGVMANENALKLIFQKKALANRILAFEHCFAGRTWAFSQITDKPNFRIGLPQNVFVDYISFQDENKGLQELKGHLKRYPGKHAAMIFELVQGEGGIIAGSRHYFEEIMGLLKEEGVAVLVDEVQTFGRTPSLFAFQHYGLQKYVDVITIGKVSQACATLYNEDYQPGPGLLSQTFTSSTSMIRASKVIIETLINGSYFGQEGKIARLERQFIKRMERVKDVEGPFGLGTMLAFTPYKGDFEQVNKLSHRLFEAGVITFVTGQFPTRIRLLLSVTTTDQDLDKILDIIEKTL